MRFARCTLGVLMLAALVGSISTPASASPARFSVQLDAFPPKGEFWEFTKFFPGDYLSVHRGDVVHAVWSGFGDHTATFVPTVHPDGWRKKNQSLGGPFAVQVPDKKVGGDDKGLVFNPRFFSPTKSGCGKGTNPCTFDGTSVLNSGDKANHGHKTGTTSFSVKITAPPGQYTMLCLFHAGMQVPLFVVPKGKPVPTPSQDRARGIRQLHHSTNVDARAADKQAQSVHRKSLSGGHHLVSIHAGGSVAGVDVLEYPNSGISMKVGDRLRVLSTSEIHTATLPKTAFRNGPSLFTAFCEVPGPDKPPPCAGGKRPIPQFGPAVHPTAKRTLKRPTAFRNSGLLIKHTPGPALSAPQAHAVLTFVARRPGTYTMICLVHGPIMQTKVTVT